MESKTTNETTLNSRTGFSEDGAMPTASYAGGSSDTISSAAMSVADFLRIPQQVVKGTWSSLDLVGQQLSLDGKAYLPTDDLLTLNALWKNKLEGYALIRSTMVVRVQLNANPFMSGKLYFHYLPAASRHSDDAFEETHNYNICSISSQHGLDIDARDTGAELRLPYNTPFNWYALWKGTTHATSDVCERGRLYLTVQSALRSFEPVDCGFSIWVHWEDVELAGPIVPQAKGFSKSVTDSEESKMHDRTISSALSAGAVVARALGNIPALKPLTGPTEWALEAAAGVAASFGYAKPKLSEPYGLMVNQPYRYAACGDGETTAIPLGLKHNAGTRLASEAVEGDVDETSWNYLKKIPALMRSFTWSNSQAPGTLLHSIDLKPAAFNVSFPVTGGSGQTKTAITGDAIATFCQFFKYWRGGRELHLRFAKTDFHTGRVEILYCPGEHTVAPTFDTGAYVLREVVDLSITNSVKLVLPYIEPSDYLDIDQSLGTVHIFVSTALRAASTVSSDIECMVWSCAADDFEFAVPAGANQLFVPLSAEGADDALTHGGVVDADLGAVGDVEEGPSTTVHSSRAIGENFNSLRSLLLAPTRLYPEAPLPGGKSLSVAPWFTSVARVVDKGGLPSLQANGQLGGDMYSALAGMYAYAKGGMRLLLHNPSADLVAYQDPYGEGSNVVWSPTAPIPDDTLLPYYERASGPRGLAMTYGDTMQVEIPYYNYVRKHVLPFSSGLRTVDQTVPTSSVIFSDLGPTAIMSTAQLYRSIADDHQLSSFCGFIPLGSKTLAGAAAANWAIRRFTDVMDLAEFADSIVIEDADL